jgi:uncharacterized ferritin-like protein (DUF455 family)/glycerate-2-kinase
VTDAGFLLHTGYRAALAAVHGRAAVSVALAGDAAPQRSVHVLALGKAAEAMLAGATLAWPEAIVRALVVAPAGSDLAKPADRFPVDRRTGNHPVPDVESLAAGHAVAAFLREIPPADTLLVLLSGGASALVELPRTGVDLPLLQELNTRLLAAGLDIRVMNALRSRFSQLKAGGAAALCPSRDIRVLFISDVPEDAPASVGSGPFWAPELQVPLEAAPDIGWPELGHWLDRLEMPKPAERRPVHRLVAGNADARRAVTRAAADAGEQAWDHGLFPELSGPWLAAHLVRFLRAAPAGVHVWGGEAAVRLPERSGRGGRAQHLAALLLLLWMARGWPRPIEVLCAATDGVDGNSGSAGAWFGDRAFGRDAGHRGSLRDALRAADTAAFWEGLGQTVPGTETGTNVMDLLIVRLGSPPHRIDERPSAMRRASGVHAMALRALQIRDPRKKCECVERLLEAWRAGGLGVDPLDPPPERIEIPGRPEQPALVRPQDLPRRGLHTLRGRQALLHAVTHIEFNAINLALDAVYRFRGLPSEYISDWLQVAAEEARHFQMLAQRLTRAGSAYGAWPAHNGLWEMAVKTDADAMERMALVPRVLEARGLDVTPGMIQRLQAVGDVDSVAVLQVIQREEISHVAIGTRWFRHLAAQRGLDPEETFLELLARHMPGRVRPPFALDARLAAGFSRSEMAALEAQAVPSGRPQSTG